jgi:hypothetical protein
MFKSLPMPGVKIPQPDSEEEEAEEDSAPLPPGVRASSDRESLNLLVGGRVLIRAMQQYKQVSGVVRGLKRLKEGSAPGGGGN